MNRWTDQSSQTRFFFRRNEVFLANQPLQGHSISRTKRKALSIFSLDIFFPTLLQKIGMKSGKVQKGWENVIQKRRKKGWEEKKEEEENTKGKKKKKRIGRGDDEVLCRLSGKSRIQRVQGISLYSGWKLEEEEEEEADDARGVICTQKREARSGNAATRRLRGKRRKGSRRGEKRAERVYLPERVIARRRAVDQGPGTRTIARRVNTNARIKIG